MHIKQHIQHTPGLLPGLLLSAALALFSLCLADFAPLKRIGISASILAIVIGIFIGNTVYPRLQPLCNAGVQFSKQRILRWGIILFGIKLTFQDVAAIGTVGIMIDVLIISTTFMLTLYLNHRFLGLDQQSAILIGSGASICGAAAVMATAPVINASSDKTSIAVSTVVIFGTLGMFIYPLMYAVITHYWAINESAFGIYIGSTIHEVAQVAAAGHAVGEAASNSAVITKMIRVLMLAPFLLILSVWQAYKNRKEHNAKSATQMIAIPWFAVGFMLMAGVGSLNVIPPNLTQLIIQLDNLLLTIAMTALGLTTHYAVLKQAGIKPLLLALAIFTWLVFGGALINASMHWIF